LALIAAIVRMEDSSTSLSIPEPSTLRSSSHSFDSSLKLGGGDFALFLDNLSVHKTKDAKLLFEELNITEIFNVPYCPQFNGIESYFSQVKATYKKLLLQHVIKEAHYDTMDLIKRSL
jgi:hypothetical protein